MKTVVVQASGGQNRKRCDGITYRTGHPVQLPSFLIATGLGCASIGRSAGPDIPNLRLLYASKERQMGEERLVRHVFIVAPSGTASTAISSRVSPQIRASSDSASIFFKGETLEPPLLQLASRYA